MASEHETATDYVQAIAHGQREHGLMGAPDTTQDRWGTDRKVKILRLSVGDHELLVEGENLSLDDATFKLIDIWVKAITPDQAKVDALTKKLTDSAGALSQSVEANTPHK